MARYKIETSDKLEHLQALHGEDFLLALWDLDEWLRKQVKYNMEINGDERDTYDIVRTKLREIMEYYNVNLDMLE